MFGWPFKAAVDKQILTLSGIASAGHRCGTATRCQAAQGKDDAIHGGPLFRWFVCVSGGRMDVFYIVTGVAEQGYSSTNDNSDSRSTACLPCGKACSFSQNRRASTNWTPYSLLVVLDDGAWKTLAIPCEQYSESACYFGISRVSGFGRMWRQTDREIGILGQVTCP
jgi:hypothetical protein